MSGKKTAKQDQHNDWGHSQAGSAGSVQSGSGSGSGTGSGANIGGNPGSQHNDWGHSPVPTAGNKQSEQGADEARKPGKGGLPRQGVMPGEEMGHLHGRWSRGADGDR